MSTSKATVTSNRTKSNMPMQTSKRLGRPLGPTSKNIGKSGKLGTGLGGSKTKNRFTTTNTNPTDDRVWVFDEI